MNFNLNLDNILSGLSFNNGSNPFIYETTNVDGVFKFLKTVCIFFYLRYLIF
jgi:hypothetical protein